MIRLKNESGYVLPYLLVAILLITTLVIVTFNLFFIFNKYEIKKYNKKKLDLACYSAVQQFISGEFKETKSQNIQIDSISVLLNCSYYGFYYRIQAEAKNRMDSSSFSYLLGAEIAEPFSNALVISKSNMDLIVTGKTKIKGDLLGTSPKVTKGFIPGIDRVGDEFLVGKIRKEEMIETQLFNSNLWKKLTGKERWFYSGKDITLKGNVVLDGDFIAKTDSIKNIYVIGDLIVSGELQSKNKKPLTISVTGKTTFENGVKSRTDIQVFCDSTVTIENSDLENVIIYAKGKIELGNGTICKNVQLFSDKGIECNKVKLYYPSLLCLNSGEIKSPQRGKELKIYSSNINGTIMLLSSAFSSNTDKSKIVIESNTIVQGLVYSEKYVEINNSKIIGAIYTNGFYYYKEPSEYINWLVDQDIDRGKLDKKFLLPLGYVKTPRLQIIKEEWNY